MDNMVNAIIKRFQSYCTEQDGSIAVAFGLVMTALTLGGSIALDYSSASGERTKMQAALDSAVTAATKARSEGNPNWRKLGEDVMASNYPKSPVVKPVLTLDGEIVRGSAARDVPLQMARFLGSSTLRVDVKSSATMRRAQANACILALDPGTGVNLSGQAEIDSNCGIHSNGSAANNYNLSGLAKIKTVSNTGVGGSNISGLSSIVTPVQANAEFFPDPLLSLPEPTATGGCRNVNLSGINTVSYSAGRYCQFNVSGIATITLGPGIHTFEAPMNLSGIVNLKGDKVLLHIASGGSASLSGSGSFELKADPSGAYAGIALFQSRSNTSNVNISGVSDIKFDGVLYAPKATLNVSGISGTSGAIRSDIAIIVNAVNYSGLSKLRINRDIGSCGTSAILPEAVMAMCRGGSSVGVQLVQ